MRCPRISKSIVWWDPSLALQAGSDGRLGLVAILLIVGGSDTVGKVHVVETRVHLATDTTPSRFLGWEFMAASVLIGVVVLLIEVWQAQTVPCRGKAW